MHGQSVAGGKGLAAALALVVSAQPTSLMAADDTDFLVPDQVPVPEDNKMTPERVKLGKMLFFDPRLSGSDWISCATCHHPGMGWSDGLPKGIGEGQQELDRATPTIVNTAFQKRQFWDGRASSLEEQVLMPIASNIEMNQDLDALVAELKAVEGYVVRFQDAYPAEGISKDSIAKAIATFERTIISRDAPFDQWVKGDEDAISASAKRGFKLFKGKANCIACHHGFNFQDNGFHDIGLKDTSDEGRYAQVPVDIMKHAFKTPTLRNVAVTPPYMHNGSYDTLMEVVEHYNRGGDRDKIDPNMRSLGLTEQEKEDLVAFLKTLTGEPVKVVIPRLPR